MGKELSPLAVVAILALFLAIGVPAFLIYKDASELPRLTHISEAPNGHLFVPYGEKLYEYDGNLAHKRTIDLGRLGVNSQSGELVFFSNGDLLIRQGEDEHSLLENLQKFFRHENRAPETAATNEKGLVRCDLQSMSCVPFGDPPLNLNRTFHIATDWQSDRVFIADSARHKIKLLSSEGKLQFQIEEGVKFPNKLHVKNDLLYVANTNRHQISVYKITDDGFVHDHKKSFRTDPKELKAWKHRWPSSLLLIDEEVWVINCDNEMANGKLVRFAGDGELVGTVALKESSDPFSMLRMNDIVLISDTEKSRIHRYSLRGEILEDMDLGPLALSISENERSREQYHTWVIVLIALFVIAIVVGIAISIRQGLESRTEIPKPGLAEQYLNLNSPDIIWLEVLPKFRRQMKFSTVLIFVLLAMFPILSGSVLKNLPIDMLLMLGAIVPILILTGTSIYKLTNQKIGILNDLIILMAGKDSHAAGSGKSIYYSHNQIGVGSIIVTLKTNQPMFSEDELVEYVYPLLRNATSISNEQMMLEKLRNKPWVAFLWIVAIAGIVLAFFAIENGWLR